MGLTAAHRRRARIVLTDAGTGSGAIATELDDADMLVFMVGIDAAIDARWTATIAAQARRRGILVAAVIVGEPPSGEPSSLLATLREAADTITIVHNPTDAHDLIAALR
jgi:hypothetical protein